MIPSAMKFSVLLIFTTLSILCSVSSSSPSSSSMCHPQINPFLFDLQLQCPITIASSLPIEMDKESLARLLSSKTNAYMAILFYASWCPFSRNAQPKFDALASMYPQIKHVKVEQSSSLPSVFSRHGIHSVPSILLVNATSRAQHHGPKDLHSLLHFYRKTTGLEPVVHLTEDQLNSSESSPGTLRFQNITSFNDIIISEPYLVFSFFFLLLKSFLYLYPKIVSNLRTLWVTYIPRLNLSIFGESRQILARALHLFNIKSALGNLKLSKNRNFHNGARSARVLASSLASVSLGESSSARE